MRSMTGCGRGHATDGVWDVTIDIKSVNHRFLDLSVKLSNDLIFLHDTVRKEIAKHLIRGHLDIIVTVKRIGAGQGQVAIDTGLAAAYYEKAQEIADLNHCENGLTAGQLLSLQGVCTVSESSMDPEAVTKLAADALQEATQQVVDMRLQEGAHLREDLAYHLGEAEKLRLAIAEKAPQIPAQYRQKLLSRLESLQVENIDPARIAQEVALIADKCAIDEELSRLSSHFHQMHVYLDAQGEIGKKMDFLIQEMNREANTIGSKAMDAEIAQYVVNLKSEIEKMREQVQNVE